MAEGRFQRWSRLKRKGGADARDEARLEEARDRQGSAAPTMEELPGGKLSRTVAPPLPSLAAEEADDPKADVVLPPTPPGAVEVDALAGLAATEDFFAGLEEGELTEEEQAVVADLPPLDSLTKDSDFTPFLQPGVPDIIKHKALRLLWRKDPFFNIRDGLNDYDEDYTVLHKVISELTGNYTVGRGHLSEDELREMTPERARKAFGMDEEEGAEEASGDSEGPPDSGETAAATEGRGDINAPKNGPAETDLDDVGDGEDEPLA